MNGINKVILIGNVGSIDIKESVTRISLATSDSYTSKQTGEKVENTSWHNLVFFARVAEIANQYVQKGDKLYIEGSLKYGKYTDEHGIERYTTSINVRNMQMLTSKKDKVADDNRGAVHPSMDANANKGYGGDSTTTSNDDFPSDDIPF